MQHALWVQHPDPQVSQISLPDACVGITYGNYKGLNLLYINIEQFLNKRDDLELAITGNDPDIILITEILPKAHCNTLTAVCLSLSGYSSIFNFDPMYSLIYSLWCGHLCFSKIVLL